MTCESLACCGGANVVVKGSFLDLDDQCLMRQYRKLRRVMSDSILVGVLDVPEVYEPGRFSNDVEKARPKAQQTPPEQATCSCVQLRCSYVQFPSASIILSSPRCFCSFVFDL